MIEPISFPKSTTARPLRRRGLSLVELMISMVIVAGLMLALAGLSTAVQDGAIRNQGIGKITQHARVSIQRISRTIKEATTSQSFPGIAVIAGSQEGWIFPDTLVVWSTEGGAAANSTNGPLVSELVLYTWNPDAPNELLEITDRDDSSTALTPAELSAWQTNGTITVWQNVIDGMMASNTRETVVLSDMLRVASSAWWTNDDPVYQRGCVRFHTNLRPSQDEWNDYQDGAADWNDLSWAMGIRGADRGLRRVAVWIELQLDPIAADEGYSSTELPPAPFFGSASLHYQLEK